MVGNNRGYSLVEIMVSLAVSAVALYLISGAVVDVYRNSQAVAKETGTKTDLSLLSAVVQKSLLRSDVKLYGFAASSTGIPLGRFLIPRMNLCADGQANCAGEVSIVWSHYDNKSPTIPVICALDHQTVIVDASRADFGNVAFSGLNANVSSSDNLYPEGNISLAANEVIALIDEPMAVMFKVSQAPQKFNAQYDSETKTYGDEAFGSNSDCVDNVKDPQQLYSIQIAPYMIPDSGTQSPTFSKIQTSMGSFPVRLAPIKIMSLGLQDTKFPTKITMNRCGGDLSCKEVLVTLDEVRSFHVQETLNTGLQGQTSFKAIAFSNSKYCEADLCQVFTIPAMVPVAVAGEKEEILQPTGFSLLKQDYVRSINFYIEREVVDEIKKSTVTRLETFHATSF